MISMIKIIQVIHELISNTSQVGLVEHMKKEYWTNIDVIVEKIPVSEKSITREDFNSHIDKINDNAEWLHRDLV